MPRPKISIPAEKTKKEKPVNLCGNCKKELHKGRPLGVPGSTIDARAAKYISQQEFDRILQRFLFLTPLEVEQAIAPERKPSALEASIGGIVLQTVRKKDEKKLEWLLARSIGKVATRTENKHLHASVDTALEPKPDPLALDSPNLTMAQLDAFEEKVSKIKDEIKNRPLVIDTDPEDVNDAQ